MQTMMWNCLLSLYKRLNDDRSDYKIPSRLLIILKLIVLQGQKEGETFSLTALSDALLKAATPTAQAARPSPALLDAYKTLTILRGSANEGFDNEKLTSIIRNVLREPVAQTVLSKVFAELSERAAARFVRRVFNAAPLPSTPVPSRTATFVKNNW